MTPFFKEVIQDLKEACGEEWASTMEAAVKWANVRMCEYEKKDK